MAREAVMAEKIKDDALLQGIPVKVTASYIFAGPSVQPGTDCFQCFHRSLEDNESYLAGILENSTDDLDDLNDFERECLANLDSENLNRMVALISRKDYTVEYLPVHCHPMTECTEREQGSITPGMNRASRMDPGKRTKKGNEIFNQAHNGWLISPHSGIGKRIVRDWDSRIVPMYYVKSNVLSSRYYSYGRSETLETSRTSAEFEMLERYASIVPHTKPELTGSYNELTNAGYRMVSPERLSMSKFSDEVRKQYGFDTYSDDKSYRWRKTMNLTDGLEYYLPEQVMYYDAQLVNGEKRFLYETSNGCAMGGTYEEAVVYALLELVERDAFLMHWYNRIAPKLLDISGVKNSYLRDVARYMNCIGYEMRVMDITMETGIPAIWVAAIDRNHHGRMKCYNAAGAHMDPEKALEGALVEVATSIGIYDRMIRSGKLDERLAKLSGQPDNVVDMEDHVYFYAMEENYHHIEPYYRNEEKIDFTERFRDWYSQEDHSFTPEQFIARFRDRHKDIYVGVLDSEVNRELGLWCVKAVIPTMLTMTFGVRNQRLNMERIRKGAVEAGITDREIPEEEINTTPHPFP